MRTFGEIILCQFTTHYAPSEVKIYENDLLELANDPSVKNGKVYWGVVEKVGSTYYIHNKPLTHVIPYVTKNIGNIYQQYDIHKDKLTKFDQKRWKEG